MQRPLDHKPSPPDEDAGEDNRIDRPAVKLPAESTDADGKPRPDPVSQAESIAGLTGPEDDLERRLRRLSRRGFASFGAAAMAGVRGLAVAGHADRRGRVAMAAASRA